MSELEHDKVAFARVVAALEPYLEDIVFVGGWSHRLYLLHPLAGTPDFRPLTTRDADIAAPLRLPVRGEGIAHLLKAAGFTENFKGDDTPPISEYSLGTEGASLFVEFLAPQLGGAYRRDGTPDDTVAVGGVTAQKLRHVDVLLTEPWHVRLHEGNGFPLGKEGRVIQIPNPASYLAQKLLVLRRRARDKQSKDLLYVHDTLVFFADALDELRGCWARVAPGLHANVRGELDVRLQELFAAVSPLARQAAVIAQSTGRPNPPTAQRLTQACRVGLQAVFAPEDA